MSGEVLVLPGALGRNSELTTEPDSTIVELLQELEKRAKAGEITGIGVFWVDRGGNGFSDWIQGRASALEFVGESAIMHSKLMKAALE